nr:hypothetical protein [Tanacetum cinerariifolium]
MWNIFRSFGIQQKWNKKPDPSPSHFHGGMNLCPLRKRSSYLPLEYLFGHSSKKQVAETQHAEVTVATANATKSLEDFELAEEQGNQPSAAKTKKEPKKIVEMEEDAEDQSMEIPTIEQLLDEVDKQKKVVQETLESPYDTESKIKVVKSYFTSQIPKLQDHIMHDSGESANYESIPEDDLRYVLGFEATDSDDTQSNDVSHLDHTFLNHNASDERLSLPYHLDHICEEASSLHSKLRTMESSIIHQVSDGIKSTLPALVITALQEQLSGLLLATLKEEPTPLRDSSKGKAVAIIEEPRNELVKYQEEEGFDSKMPKLKSFITPEGPLSHEEYNNQIREMKRLNDLKAEQERTEHELRKMFNPATLKAHAQKMTKLEAKKAMMMQGYKHQISFRADTLPITKISYVVNSRKEETMKITRGDNPLNIVVHPNFRLKTLGFSEWLEVHALASKKSKTSNNLLLVDGIDKNLIPPPGIMPIQGLVINEPESGIFFMNGNTDIGFQRESEFHLTPTIELIRLQKQIKVDLEISRKMFSKMNYVIESRSDCIKAREIVEKNLDNMG